MVQPAGGIILRTYYMVYIKLALISVNSGGIRKMEKWKIGKLENWETGKLKKWKIEKLENWKIGKLEMKL